MTYATIDGFEDLTPQQVFDISKNHLLQQNQQSLDDYGNCMYLSDCGLKCAAGVFLKNESIEGIEGFPWIRLVSEGLVPTNNEGLIQELQAVHDNNDSTLWEEKLAKVARNNNLVY